MGSILNILDGIDDSAPGGADQRELIETLDQLARSRAQLFERDLKDNAMRGDAEFRAIPVVSLEALTTQAHGIPADGAVRVAEKATQEIARFVAGGSGAPPSEIVGRLVQPLGERLASFLGDGEAVGDRLEQTLIYLDGPRIQRLDLRTWKRGIARSGLRTRVSAVAATVAARARVDVSRAEPNALLRSYGDALRAAGYQGRALEDATDALKDIVMRSRDAR